MNFKGITWVGNVYQKFEAMCLEVEEIIVQDTAKYVEKQVQTVGNCVKRFCSDVVQDLLPDDSVPSGKPLPVSMLHEYAPVCSSFKKKSESMNQKGRVVKQEQDVTEGKKDGFATELRGLDSDDYDICTSPRQYSNGGPYRRTRQGRKQIYKKEVTRPYMQKDSTSISVVHRTRVKTDVGTVKSSDPPPPGEVATLISKKECKKDDTRENQKGLTVVNSVISVDEHDLAVASSDESDNQHRLTVVDSIRNQDAEIRTEDEHGLAVAKTFRSQDSEIQPSFAISLPAESDDCRKETKEDRMQTSSSSVSEQKSEILQQLSGRSVEESCIIVDRDELHCVFPGREENDRHKPYKKIGDAMSSRMKQNIEQEYKRLAHQWYTEDVENPKQIEEDRSSEESEWEFL